MRFDPSMPFDEVHGMEGAAFAQGGHLFRRNGWPLGATEAPQDPDPAPDDAGGGGFSGKHWKVLKALVEQYGGVWTNKADAVAFLEGLN